METWLPARQCSSWKGATRKEIRRQMSEYMKDRKIKQPLHLPSAGCVFQNPSGRGAGRYIDGAGLKGLRVGGAEVSHVHANFIVNVGDATARDVLILMNVVRRSVYDKFGVEARSRDQSCWRLVLVSLCKNYDARGGRDGYIEDNRRA